MGDHLLAQVLAAIFAALALLFGGIKIRKEHSAAKRVVAENDAESGFIGGALAAMAVDRDRWRASAEEAWGENGQLREQLAQLKAQAAQHKLNMRIVRKFPQLAGEFVSAPGALDTLPPRIFPPAPSEEKKDG